MLYFMTQYWVQSENVLRLGPQSLILPRNGFLFDFDTRPALEQPGYRGVIDLGIAYLALGNLEELPHLPQHVGRGSGSLEHLAQMPTSLASSPRAKVLGNWRETTR